MHFFHSQVFLVRMWELDEGAFKEEGAIYVAQHSWSHGGEIRDGTI